MRGGGWFLGARHTRIDAGRRPRLDDQRRLRQRADGDVEHDTAGDIEVVGVELLSVLEGGERERRDAHRTVAVRARLRPESGEAHIGAAVEVGHVDVDAGCLGGCGGIEGLAVRRLAGVGERVDLYVSAVVDRPLDHHGECLAGGLALGRLEGREHRCGVS